MRNHILLLLACCLGLSGAVSCSTRQTPSSAQSPPSQAAADAAAAAKAKKEKEADIKAAKEAAEKERKEKAAAAKTQKAKEEADAKAAKKAKEEAARQAKAAKSNPAKPPSAGVVVNTNMTAAPAPDANAPLTREQSLANLTRRYINNEISPLEYQTERAKIMAGP
jgi:cytoskeletal protein RodZ